MKKIKILAYCDTPVVSTGFATISRNLLLRLQATSRYDITVWGINHYGMPYDHWKYQFPIYPAPINDSNDPYGRKGFLKLVEEKDFDILWSLQDPFIMRFLSTNIDKIKASKKTKFKWVFYSSLDHPPIADWLAILSKADYPVMWNEWALQEMTKTRPELRHKFKSIYFGVDTDTFKPLDKKELGDFRNEYFGIPQIIKPDTFIITNINRNQRRKDWLRTLLAYKQFKKLRPNSILYMHTKVGDDSSNDFDLDLVANQLGLKPLLDYTYPDQTKFLPGQEYTGIPPDVLNKVYNVSDVIISTALGEGVGLSSYEALAAKRPIVMPNNSALTETMAEGRGFPVKSGLKDSDLHLDKLDSSLIRPAIDIDDMVKQLLYVHDNPKEAAKAAQKGYDWIIKKEWSIIFKEWDELFQEIYRELQFERGEIKVGRNEPCYCGSGIKFKKCHGMEAQTIKTTNIPITGA